MIYFTEKVTYAQAVGRYAAASRRSRRQANRNMGQACTDNTRSHLNRSAQADSARVYRDKLLEVIGGMLSRSVVKAFKGCLQTAEATGMQNHGKRILPRWSPACVVSHALFKWRGSDVLCAAHRLFSDQKV